MTYGRRRCYLSFLVEVLEKTFNARQERKTSAELMEMLKGWEALVSIREERYPGNYRAAVTQNDLACILLEFYGIEHPLSTGRVKYCDTLFVLTDDCFLKTRIAVVPLLQSCAEILMKNVVVPG